MSDFVDTNVLVRFFVGDNHSQQKKAAQWFKEAERGERVLIIHPLVVAETTFVLESFYKISREQIAATWEVFLAQRWLQVDEREALLKVWDNYRKKIHFVDAYLAALSQSTESSVLTFDKALHRVLK
jgi:predicted nucleic-acid-binding protein